MNGKPLYPIGTVSSLLEVHQETIRVWERKGIINPQRKNTHRYYSNDDLKRLSFIKKLIHKGLNLPALQFYLSKYPCWNSNDCPACANCTSDSSCLKECWKEEGSYCQIEGNPEACINCEFMQNQ